MRRWKAKPSLFVTEALKTTPEPWQADVLDAFGVHDRLAIRSGHGVGKSALLAWIILFWHITRFPAKTACTAPTSHQIDDILWSEIAKWHRKMADPFATWIIVKSDKVELIEDPKESFAVARTARADQPEAFQGFHSENMLFIGDEASGIPEIIFEVGQGAMSTAGAKTVITGNPTKTTGYFYDAFDSHRKHWWTKRVSCLDSALVTPDYPIEVAEKYGVESNVYRVRVLGEFPLEDDDAVIPLHLIEEAAVRDVEPSGPVVWGVDIARFGSDRSALAKRRPNALIEPIKWWRGKDLMEMTGILVNEYKACPKNDIPMEIAVDSIGLGSGGVDRLKELGLPVKGVNVSESPSSSDQYLRLRDELWFKAREWFAERSCVITEDQALMGELTMPRYKVLSSGKMQVETKDEIKKRRPQSPDLADAFVMTFAGNPFSRRAAMSRFTETVREYNPLKW